MFPFLHLTSLTAGLMALSALAPAQNVSMIFRGTANGDGAGTFTNPILSQLRDGDPVDTIFCLRTPGSATTSAGLRYELNLAQTRIRTPYGLVEPEPVNPVDTILINDDGFDLIQCQARFDGGVTCFAIVTNLDESLLSSDDLLDLVGTSANYVSGGSSVTHSYSTGPNGGVGITLEEIFFEPCELFGTAYCSVNPNSTGVEATLSAQGSSDVISNDLTILSAQLPAFAFSFVIVSQSQGFTSMPGGSQGNLCLGGSIGRYVGPGQIQQANAMGAFALTIDLTNTPQPLGPVAIQPGETWNFQAWYRDAGPAGPTSNFTNGFEVPFF
ncbi:MAG: hypothetical protein AAGG01_03590 [Planctomycetota bacterium]